jgi:hypothetical protein
MTMMILSLKRYVPGITTGSASISRINGIILVVFFRRMNLLGRQGQVRPNLGPGS